jgi:hypothetical protein
MSQTLEFSGVAPEEDAIRNSPEKTLLIVLEPYKGAPGSRVCVPG